MDKKLNGVEIESKLIVGVNLCNNHVIRVLDDYLKLASTSYSYYENHGQYINEVELTNTILYSGEIIIIKDFNCRKKDAIALSELMLRCNRKLIISSENYNLIDELIKLAKKEELNIIGYNGDWYYTSDLLYRLRFDRGLEIF